MASPAEEAQVREATRRVIQGVDLETVKEKQIVEMVEAQLGILLGDDEALMACLQEEIETFLLDDTAVAKAGPGQTKPSKTAAAKRRRSVVEDEDDFNEDPEDGDWDHTQEDEDDDVDLDEDELEPKKRKDDMNAAREKWSEPAPAPTGNVVLTAGAPAAPVPGAPVPEDKLLTALQLKGDDGATAKELAGFLKIGKSEVNKVPVQAAVVREGQERRQRRGGAHVESGRRDFTRRRLRPCCRGVSRGSLRCPCRTRRTRGSLCCPCCTHEPGQGCGDRSDMRPVPRQAVHGERLPR
jgi:hypothetical protein